MSKVLAFRDDYDASALRVLARATKQAVQSRGFWPWRRPVMAPCVEMPRVWAGTDRQIVRDWGMRFNAQGGKGTAGSSKRWNCTAREAHDAGGAGSPDRGRADCPYMV